MVAILVVDPRKRYREVLTEALGSWFTVYSASTLADAAQAWSLHRPEAALASIVQTGETHGLDLLARLRRGSRARDVTLIAYGRPGGKALSDEAVTRLRKSKGIDEWVAATLEPQDLQAKVLGLLLRLRTFDTHGQVPIAKEWLSVGEPERPVISARRAPEPRVERLRRIISTPIGMEDKTWREQEPSWGQMLRSPANIKNIRRLVRKAVTGQAVDSADSSRELDEVGS